MGIFIGWRTMVFAPSPRLIVLQQVVEHFFVVAGHDKSPAKNVTTYAAENHFEWKVTEIKIFVFFPGGFACGATILFHGK